MPFQDIHALLRRLAGEIALLGAHFEVLGIWNNAKRTELTIGDEVVRLVGHRILVSQLSLNFIKSIRQFFDFERKECFSGSFLRENLEVMVAAFIAVR